MKSFYETVDKETKQEADEFIERIKDGTLRPRREPSSGLKSTINMNEYLQKCSESFDNLVKSKEFKEMMSRAYK